ncbi:MAG: SDR family oxidoreductase [marine benthic group bacterium]|nr:SDR family oxidoreductase [Gemmatimonadota bacterium]
MTEAPVVVVLGGTGGIGSQLIRTLTSGGARVLAVARTEADLAALAMETGAETAKADATRFEAVEEVTGRARNLWGRIDGIVNCVGSVLLRPAHMTSEAAYRETIAQNLDTAFAAVRAGGKTMQEGGSIVLVSTAAVRSGLPNHEAIAAAKGGVEGLVRSAAATYGPAGIRVNAVAPGLVRTPLTERITSNERASEASRSLHALGRLGEPEDVASAIAWLLEPGQSWVTGQVLGVDGGLGSARTMPRG